jgi:hypothetical protein
LLKIIASGPANTAKSDFDHHWHFYTNLFLLLLHNFQSYLAKNQQHGINKTFMKPTPNHTDPGLNNQAPDLINIDKEKHARLLQRGMIWIAAGVVVCGLSFAIQYLLFHSGDQSLISYMYVLTSVGAVLILKGMIDIIGF